MTEYLDAVRESYDTVAAAYDEQVEGPMAQDPLMRAMFGAFAELARGKVADVGCGPGKITAYLHELGLDAYGIDLSPNMIELARAAHPQLRFEVGTMTALDVADGELGGVLAHFSTHHTPPEHLPRVYAELHRALGPGGHLMLWTHTGDNERRQPTQAYGGHPVTYESHRLPAERLADLLVAAGFRIKATLIEPPPRPNACFVAVKV